MSPHPLPPTWAAVGMRGLHQCPPAPHRAHLGWDSWVGPVGAAACLQPRGSPHPVPIPTIAPAAQPPAAPPPVASSPNAPSHGRRPEARPARGTPQSHSTAPQVTPDVGSQAEQARASHYVPFTRFTGEDQGPRRPHDSARNARNANSMQPEVGLSQALATARRPGGRQPLSQASATGHHLGAAAEWQLNRF